MRPVSLYIWVFAYSMAFDLDTWYLLVLHVSRKNNRASIISGLMILYED